MVFHRFNSRNNPDNHDWWSQPRQNKCRHQVCRRRRRLGWLQTFLLWHYLTNKNQLCLCPTLASDRHLLNQVIRFITRTNLHKHRRIRTMSEVSALCPKSIFIFQFERPPRPAGPLLWVPNKPKIKPDRAEARPPVVGESSFHWWTLTGDVIIAVSIN